MRLLFLSMALFACLQQGRSQIKFDEWFEPSTLRIDWLLCGNDTSTQAFLHGFKKQSPWGGSQTQLIDSLGYGSFWVEVANENGRIIYSKGFCTLFEEWQTTLEAKAVQKAFPQVIEVPYPKTKSRIAIKFRPKNQVWRTLLVVNVDPLAVGIEKISGNIYEVRRIAGLGTPNKSVDLAFVAEGYTAEQMEKFYGDVKRLSAFLLKQEPFVRYAGRFNVWAVGVPSAESGTDDPNRGIWRNTALNSSFNTFGTDRYLETFDVPAIHNVLQGVPHDHVVVVVNTNKYGGGGVYNHFSIVTADNKLSPTVFVHEFGHGFGGLGDEYYDSEVAYTDYIDLTVEPWEPNLTTLVGFEKKWKQLVDDKTPVPTPNQKEYKDVVGAFEGAHTPLKGFIGLHWIAA